MDLVGHFSLEDRLYRVGLLVLEEFFEVHFQLLPPHLQTWHHNEDTRCQSLSQDHHKSHMQTFLHLRHQKSLLRLNFLLDRLSNGTVSIRLLNQSLSKQLRFQ